MKILPAPRNHFAAAWQHSENLYDNAVALNQMLDVYSKRDPGTQLNRPAIDYLTHNLANAKSNIARLEAALSSALLRGAPQAQPDEVQHA